MELTEKAEALLKSYDQTVSQRLANRDDVEIADVLAGIHEHIEAELLQRGATQVTAEDMAEILDRLGGPSQWSETGGLPATNELSATPVAPRWPDRAALTLTLVGGIFVLSGVWWAFPLGWGLVVAGVLLARVSLEDKNPEADQGTEWNKSGPIRRSVLLLWWMAITALVIVLLVAPALLTWVMALTGGPLEQALLERENSSTSGYWQIPLIIGAGITALWWLLLSFITSRFIDAIHHMLGPARALIPPATSRFLLVGSGVLFIFSLIIGIVL